MSTKLMLIHLESHKENGNPIPSTLLSSSLEAESHKENGNILANTLDQVVHVLVNSHKENGNYVIALVPSSAIS